MPLRDSLRRSFRGASQLTTTRMQVVELRLRYLRGWELLNVVLVPATVCLMWWSTGDTLAGWHLRWVGLGFVSYLLLQGGVYWHLKLRMVTGGGAMPAWFAPLFSALHRSNPVLMALAAAYMLLVATNASTRDRAWGLFILGLAYVEHVNYFVRQLMHDSDADVAYLRRYRRLRRSPLRRDLDAARAHRPRER